ncbi:MAG TPA: bifunctional shikimate kinase/3-dehydroquinate synthase [Gaiellaceae bacterium]|jgi:shikimate kinase/3-dehydroquinate synthase|nr:bifunctional shikimate kinase/3-dehydroquinate synthase [Gaiellaceae bacterium]
MALNALDRHIALVGFMGAGKSTMAPLIAERLGRVAIDVDDELGVDIPTLFAEGEEAFRAVEAPRTCELLAEQQPAVLALGGGSIKSEAVREALAEHAFTVLLDVHVDEAWERVRASDRPLAQDEATFRHLNDERRPLYGGIADATAKDVDGAILAAAGVHHELGALARLGGLVPGTGPVALVADSTVLGIYGERARRALGERLLSTHELPSGEPAKQLAIVERLWSELTLDRGGTVVALGGGALTDAAGFAAATYLRGVPWVSVPTTLVGQVDAGIGGKTAIDIPQGKNLVGAFHWPARVVIDEALLETLPERERRQGLAELIKTQLLAGEELDVRGAAAYKAALCLRDPHDRGVRNWLNLGHTFAHGLEAAADFDLPHGEAVALGLLAALRLSGRDDAPVREALDPQPVQVDRERAWQALLRDKKRTGDDINLVLLGEGGPYVEARPAAEVRAALDTLIR